jgi:hypothetical protein
MKSPLPRAEAKPVSRNSVFIPIHLPSGIPWKFEVVHLALERDRKVSAMGTVTTWKSPAKYFIWVARFSGEWEDDVQAPAVVIHCEGLSEGEQLQLKSACEDFIQVSGSQIVSTPKDLETLQALPILLM